jgi:hypothetical protein
MSSNAVNHIIGYKAFRHTKFYFVLPVAGKSLKNPSPRAVLKVRLMPASTEVSLRETQPHHRQPLPVARRITGVIP